MTTNIVFTNTEQAIESTGVKVMVYAPAGYGKTVLCATCPRPVIISNESGLLSLKKRNLEKLFGVGNAMISYFIPVIQVSDIGGLMQAYNWAAKSAEAKNFDTVCLDSISEMGEVMLNMLKAGTKDPRQAYGELISQMETLIRNFRDIPNKHVYMSAKMEPFKDEFNGTTKYTVSMPGSKLGNKLPYFFDEVFALRKGIDKEGKQFPYLLTQPEIQYEAKDRSGALNAMEYPHLGAIFQKILGA